MCTLVCLPDLTYAWVFNEYPYFVQQDNRRFVSQQTGNLYIAKVEPSDVGNYTCVVTNSITKGKVHSSPTALILRTDGKTAAEVRVMTFMPHVKHLSFHRGFNHHTGISALSPGLPQCRRVLMPLSEQSLLDVGQQTKHPNLLFADLAFFCHSVLKAFPVLSHDFSGWSSVVCCSILCCTFIETVNTNCLGNELNISSTSLDHYVQCSGGLTS